MNWKQFLKSKGISDEDYAKKTVEEMAQLQTEFQEAVRKEMIEMIGKGATKNELEALKEVVEKLPKSDVTDKLQKDVTEALEGVAKLLEKTTMSGTLKDADKYKLRAMIEEKHEEIVKAVKTRQPFELSFKAAAMHMTNNGTVTNVEGLDFPVTDNVMLDSDIAKIRYPENFILNVIPNRQTSKVPAQRIRKEQATTEGAIAVTVEGAVKPLVQYKFVRTSTDRVKYAGRIEWTEEFELDFELLFREIVKMFEEDVVSAWQDGLLAQISTNATSYVASSLDDTLIAPDNGLAIVATQSQLQSLNYNPDVVIMNPADIVATMFQQDADGNLKLSPYINVTAGTINGIRLISTNKVDQGTALIGESRLYDEIHSDFIMRTGQYGDQFIENEYTAIGEVFSILQIAERDLVGWVEIDLDTVKAALLKPEEVVE